MAKAVKKENAYTLTLELSQREAEALKWLTNECNGSDTIDGLWNVLHCANVGAASFLSREDDGCAIEASEVQA